jgi:hypothetical protein
MDFLFECASEYQTATGTRWRRPSNGLPKPALAT